MAEMEKKMKTLALPKDFSVRPILIYVNGVSETLKGEDFFFTIDFDELG